VAVELQDPLEGLPERPFMYFLHSYHAAPADPRAALAVTDYGPNRFCSVILKDNVFACQFHPERSGEFGLRILKAFASKKPVREVAV